MNIVWIWSSMYSIVYFINFFLIIYNKGNKDNIEKKLLIKY